MRHLYGAAMAVLLAAAIFFGASWGYVRVFRVPVPVDQVTGSPAGSLVHNHHFLIGGGIMLAVGLAVGLAMVIPWVSPLASGLPGLVLMAWSGLYLFDVKDAIRLIPLKHYDYGVGFELLLTTGLLAMLGIAMVVPLFIPSRWRRPAVVKADEVTESVSPPLVGTVYEETFGPTGSSGISAWDQPTQTQPIYGSAPDPDTTPPVTRAPWDPAP
jgi:hypothetical protein